MRSEPWSDLLRPTGLEDSSGSFRVSGELQARSLGGRRVERSAELRFVTYLCPVIPLAFFEAVVEHIRQVLGQRASLLVEPRVSYHQSSRSALAVPYVWQEIFNSFLMY